MLDRPVGLTAVKTEVRSLVAPGQIRAERERAGLPVSPLFRPGTGKTTVARIVGRMYRETGLLGHGHLIEAKRADLAAS